MSKRFATEGVEGSAVPVEGSRHGALLGALAALAPVLQRARTLESVTEVTTRGLAELGFDTSIMRIEGDEARVIASRLDDALMKHAEAALGGPVVGHRISVTSPLLCLAEGSYRYFEDPLAFLEAAARQRSRPERPGAFDLVQHFSGVKLLLCPLTVDQQSWGLLLVSSRNLDPDDGAAIALFSAQVASAIEVVNSIEDLRKRNAQLETIHRLATEKASSLLGIMGQATGAEAAALYLLDEERRLVLDGTVGHALPDSFQTFPSDEAIVPRLREEGFQENASIPLRASGQHAGLLLLSRKAQPWSEEELQSAELFGDRLAARLELARLHADAERRVDQLRLLLDVGRVITGSLQLDPILWEATGSLVEMLGATDAFVWLLEGSELVGRLASDHSLNACFQSVRLSLSTPSSAGRAILQRAPVRIEDALTSPDVARDLNEVCGLRSLMAIPLMLREMPIGAIVVGDRRRTRRFSDAELEHAILIAGQLAVAIDNAQLFEDLKKSYHELGRTQRELVKRERLAALGELSAVVAHEVRNPLGVIFNSLASLRRMVPDGEEPRMLLEIVGEEADRLNRMVGDLLDFARPHEAQLHPESLAEVISGALVSAGRALTGHTAQLRSEVSPELPRVPMDAQMIRQALLNLVANAVQAMPRGGTITLRASLETRDEGRTFARIEVEDDGPGIPSDLADRVFEPFFTTRAAGTGLGLAVVKRIADAHRAEIALRSTPGHGSTFLLWLPT